MQPTRRFWLLIGTGASTAVVAAFLDVFLLYGVPVGLGSWLVVRQTAFTIQLQSIHADSDVSYTVMPDPVLVEDNIDITVTIDRTETPTPAGTLQIQTIPGITLTDSPTAELSAGAETIRLTTTASVSVAGKYTLPSPEISLQDSTGLFTETLPLGDPVTVTVTPRVPRDIHVGEGGDQIGIAIGDHDAAQGSAGFEPGELQEYTPGDPANRIDWKATARLQEPYIREFEAETSRQTLLIVDGRPTMHTGRSGETKLEYAREVALWLLEYASTATDPLSTTILFGDNAWQSGQPTVAETGYRRIRRHLTDLTPEQDTTSHRETWSMTASAAQDRSTDLNGNTKFDRTLAPYFTDVTTYFQRVADTPLFEITQQKVAAADGGAWTVIITDDENREELIETVRAVATEDTPVAVFILPSTLFAASGLTDISAAYDDYVDFEDFRQHLAAIPHATAYEVAPQDKLETVIQANQPRRGDIQ